MRFAWSAAVVCLGAGAFLPGGSEPTPDVVVGAVSSRPGPSDASPVPGGLSISRIEAHLRGDGGQDFVITFDGPVPDDRISYVEDITNVDAPAVAYTTQEWTPENPTPLRTCGDTHFGFSPPVVVGQADVLMPAAWFSAAPDADRITWVHHPEWYGVKTALCGPHEGYVKHAIWAPVSHDPGDIRVYFGGKTRLIVEIRVGGG